MEAHLTHGQAERRSSCVRPGIEYELYLNLEPRDTYEGLLRATFHLKHLSDNLFLDFAHSHIQGIIVNDSQLATESEFREYHSSNKIFLPAQCFKGDLNTVVVHFKNDYGHDRTGLHYYKDHDHKVYMYTQGEPYYMNKVFPLFDQPDLKGQLTLHLAAPGGWTLLSNTSQTEARPLKEVFNEKWIQLTHQAPSPLLPPKEHASLKPEHSKYSQSEIQFAELVAKMAKFDKEDLEKRWVKFAQTKPLPGYLFAFCAGEFVRVHANSEAPFRVPVDVFCADSKSASLRLQLDSVLAFATRAIDFFEHAFGVAFPFEKCDFVFCPEFKSMAMENPGLITVTDAYIFSDGGNSVGVTRRGRTIAHEIAHMWFGNLVTMKWWNDLWLNESFADFCGFLCQAEINKSLPFKTQEAWSTMMLRKNWGYSADMKPGTHAVACNVHTSSEAVEMFDGITYAKGASALKQLFSVIGRDSLFSALKAYFTKFAWKNATLFDFIHELDSQSPQLRAQGFDIWQWKADWLEQAGLNELTHEIRASEKGGRALIIKQRCHSQNHPTLRDHFIKIALFDKSVSPCLVFEASIKKDKDFEYALPDGLDVAGVLLNYQDLTFATVTFDQASTEFFTENVHLIKEPLSQMLVFLSLFHGVIDGKQPVATFFRALERLLIKSTSLSLQVLETIHGYAEICLPKLAPTSGEGELDLSPFQSPIAIFACLYSEKFAKMSEGAEEVTVYRKKFTKPLKGFFRKLFEKDNRNFLKVLRFMWASVSLPPESKEKNVKRLIKKRVRYPLKLPLIDLDLALQPQELRNGLIENLTASFHISPGDFNIGFHSLFLFLENAQDDEILQLEYLQGMVNVLKSNVAEFISTYLKYGLKYYESVESFWIKFSVTVKSAGFDEKKVLEAGDIENKKE